MPTLPYALRRVFVTLPRPYKQGLAIAFDAFILLLSFQLALWLRFELFFFDHYYLLLSVSACVSPWFFKMQPRSLNLIFNHQKCE